MILEETSPYTQLVLGYYLIGKKVRTPPIGALSPSDCRGVEFRDTGAAHGAKATSISREDLKRAADAGASHCRETVQERASDHAGFGAERDRFQDIRSAPHTAIQNHVELPCAASTTSGSAAIAERTVSSCARRDSIR